MDELLIQTFVENPKKKKIYCSTFFNLFSFEFQLDSKIQSLALSLLIL